MACNITERFYDAINIIANNVRPLIKENYSILEKNRVIDTEVRKALKTGIITDIDFQYINNDDILVRL